MVTAGSRVGRRALWLQGELYKITTGQNREILEKEDTGNLCGRNSDCIVHGAYTII